MDRDTVQTLVQTINNLVGQAASMPVIERLEEMWVNILRSLPQWTPAMNPLDPMLGLIAHTVDDMRTQLGLPVVIFAGPDGLQYAEGNPGG